MTKYCKEMVRGEGQWGSFHRHHCGHKAKRDGYCGIHHPDAVKRRREKSEERYAEIARRRKVRYASEDFNIRAGDMCRELGMEPEEIKAGRILNVSGSRMAMIC